MNAYPLSSPGDVSEWISLADVYKKAGGESEELVSKLSEVEVKIRVLDRRVFIRLDDEAKVANAVDGYAAKEIARLDADEAFLKAGLVRLRGVNKDVDGAGEEALAALSASHLTWLVAHAVRMYNQLDSDARAGFFTSAQGL